MKTVKTYSPTAKILSLVLSFLIIFYLIPASVYAEGLDGDTTVSDNSVSENEENNTYIPEIYEVTELREENVKHFRLADGSYVAAQYNYPVHYIDGNGEFEDIDNRLVESGTEFSTNNSRVKFIKKTTGNGNIFTLHENNTKITMGLVNAEKKTKGVVTSKHNSDDAIDDTLGKMTNLENISSTILYEDILDGVDIEYVVHSLNIKENIIVKEKKDAYSYTFTLELNNLTASLAENGNVYINSNDGETQYVIPAPVVFDANCIYAPDDASAYTLTEVGNGKYELNVSVDISWMNAEERAFPVIIDPAMLSPGGEILDLSIDSSSPDSNQNNTFAFYVSSTQRAYLKFDENCFTDLPIGASIMNAELSLKGGTLINQTAKIGVYPITSDWDSTLTWNKTISSIPQGTFDNTPLDYTIVSRSDNRYTWNITSLYKDWIAGEANYGVGLRLLDGSVSVRTYFSCYESQGTSDYRKPVIMVTYIYNDGLEGYYPTSTHSAGAGGVGSINLSTGRLTLAIPTLTTTDYLFAFTPTLVYNSSLAGEEVTSANTSSAFSTSYMPLGFKLNIQETIVKASYCDVDNVYHTYYILYDADGSSHRFYDDPNSSTYSDDDGLQLTLTVGTDEITIEDIDHNVKTYSKINYSSWYLTSIKDKYENELVFGGGTPGKPETISVMPNGLNSIEMLRLLYEGDKLCAVYNNTSKDSVILRYTGNKLTQVQYCYSNDTSITDEKVKNKYNDPSSEPNIVVYATANYFYDSNGNIRIITDSDTNKSLHYEVLNGKVTKLSEYAGTTLGQQVSYIYDEGYTDVRSTGNDETLNTNDDIITRYVFDGYGRSVSVYSMSSEDEKIYGATSGSYNDSEKSKNSIKSSTILGGVDPDDIIKNASNTALIVELQGGIDKTEDTGCYKKNIFEAENVETLTVSNADMEFIISGFGKANSIIQNGYAEFSLGVNVYYYQGSNEDDEVVEYRFDFADVENVWQYVCGKFYCKKESTEEISYDYVSKIELVCTYYGHLDVGINAACAYFKDIALTEFTDSSGYNYSYDPDSGNLTDKENSVYQESYFYDGENRIIRIENGYGDYCDYVYTKEDGKTIHEEKYHKDGLPVSVNTFTYDQYGLLVSTDYTGAEEDTYLDEEENISSVITGYEYITDPNSKIFGALSVETNSLGHPTKYFYDTSNGNLLAQINVDSRTGYAYSYTDAGELEYVWPAYGTASSYSGITNAESVKYDYDPITHRLSKITTDSTEYSFSYDSFGNSERVNVGDNSLATYEYYPNNGKIKKINYENGFSEEYVYDSLENLSEIWYTYDDGTSEMVYEYTYNDNGLLTAFEDIRTNKVIEYTYDNTGRLISVAEKNGTPGAIIATSGVSYDDEGRLNLRSLYFNYSSVNPGIPPFMGSTYEYGENGLIEAESHFPGNFEVGYHYDNLNRLSQVTRVCGGYPTFDYVTEYSYLDAYHYGTGDNSSYLIGTYTSTVSSNITTYSYGYDPRGNITSINKNGDQTIYTYDDLGQLLKESDGTTSRTYTYDNAGNIISIVAEPVSSGGGMVIRAVLPPPGLVPITPTTTTFSYTDSEWGDLLTAYNGHAITYDEIGNPLSYYNGSAYTFTWEGRRLVGATKGSKTMSFTYDDNGIRTSKTVNGVKHTYHLNGSQIVAEEWSGALIIYLYDSAGSPIGMMYRTVSYDVNVFDVFYFEKNLQGDIVAVYNENGTKVATYNYTDAWGNHTVSYTNGGASTGAQYNPFRYRGYYYDADLDMYYLQSRYYDPNTCRFINADGYVSTGQGILGDNMFAYCGNNPVMGYDPTGHWDWGGVIVGTLLTIAACAAAYLGFAATEVGMLVTGAVMTTGLTMVATAATDSQMVMDVSGTAGAGLLFRGGGSIVIDFDKDESNFYYHGGNGLGYAFGIGYSVGVLENYNKPMDYAGDFIDVFGGYGLGADHGWSPEGEYATAPQSFSFTFSKGLGFGIGKDTYSDPIPIFKWGGN